MGTRGQLGTGESRRGSRESGFALLLVFLMASILAITLYWQIPRVAFQSQRQKEQLLIERGEQYQRAIQLFVRANNRYPSKIEDLENFNNRRYLRHRFKDPMTGKDEWRLIHVNAAGVFTDSIANKKKEQQGTDGQASQNNFVGEQSFIVPDAAQQGQQGNIAASRRRQSEGGAAPVDVNGQPLFPPANQQQNAGPEAAPPPFLGGHPGIPRQPGQAPNPQLANQTPNEAMPQGVPGQPGQPPPTPGALSGGNPAAPFPGVNVPQEAVNSLNNSLQSARPGGLPAVPQQPPFPQPGTGAFPQPGAGGFPQPGAASQNANSTNTSSFVGTNSFVGGGSSFVGGGDFIGSSTSNPTPANPNPVNPNPGFNPSGQQPGFQPGNPQPFGQPTSPQQGFAPPNMPPQNFPPQNFLQQNFSQPGQTPGFSQPASSPAGGTAAEGSQSLGQNQAGAQNLLNNILTNPRQAGMGGAAGPQGTQIGAGIAGVASTSEAPAIMVYNDHTNYNEWEFIFDISKQRQTVNPLGVAGTPAAALGSTPGLVTGAAPGATLPSGKTASPSGGAGMPGSPIGGTAGGIAPGATPGAGTPANGQTTPGGNPMQQQSPIPPWFRFGEP